jgi:hypothetical protein
VRRREGIDNNLCTEVGSAALSCLFHTVILTIVSFGARITRDASRWPSPRIELSALYGREKARKRIHQPIPVGKGE